MEGGTRRRDARPVTGGLEAVCGDVHGRCDDDGVSMDKGSMRCRDAWSVSERPTTCS